MRTILIEAATKTYTVYEGRQMLAQYVCDQLLTAEQIEELRVMPEMPGVA